MKLALSLPGVPPALRAMVPGIAVAAALAAVAGWLAGGLGEPLSRNPVLVSMLFGLLIGNAFGCPDALRPGLQFTTRYLLRFAVILVGVRITLVLIEDLGIVPITVAAIELLVVLFAVRWVALRVFKIDRELALLLAVGCAVCGAAAILAVGALTRAREQYVGVAVALITVAGTIALMVYPVAFIGGWLPHLDDWFYGVFVGASIFEVAQVYGASFAVSEGALNTATLVKLSKVLMLVPLLLVLGIVRRHADAGSGRAPIPFPWFIVAFVAVVLLNSSFTLHPQARRLILEFDQFLFLMVMIALGLTTRLARLAEAGGAWRLLGVGIIGAGFVLRYSLRPCRSDLVQRRGAHGRADGAGHAGHDRRPAFRVGGRSKCHTPSLRGRNGEMTLYSDLLLDDMGPALDDKIVQGNATGAEWRTTPLVGLGQRTRFLHDGRADTLRDAILAHGGESEIVRNRFFDLDEAQQKAVYEFLSSL